jgi:hypothetical protein
MAMALAGARRGKTRVRNVALAANGEIGGAGLEVAD